MEKLNHLISFSKMVMAFAIFIFSIYGCKQDNNSLSDYSESLNSSTNIDEIHLSPYENLKLKIAKTIAASMVNKPMLKKYIFESIIDVNTGQSDELFFLQFVEQEINGEKVKDILAANYIGDHSSGEASLELRSSDSDFDQLITYIGQVAPNIVIDVPDYISWLAIHPDSRDVFLAEYDINPFVFFPDVHEKNSNNKYVGYGESFDGTINDEIYTIHEIGENETYIDIIPFFVKGSEINILIDEENNLLNNQSLIEVHYGDIGPEGISCINSKINLLRNSISLGEEDMYVVNILELTETTKECDKKLPPMNTPPPPPDELCCDGIDNDGDGLIDGDDPDCDNISCSEICNDGIDNDNDGLIDENDPDCFCNCHRDCHYDQNYLYRHAFDHVDSYFTVTSEQLPGIEKIIKLRYDITRLTNANCSGTDCPYQHNTRYVERQALALYCDDNDPGDDFQHLCTISGSSGPIYDAFFYGTINSNSINDINQNGNYLYFGVANGYTAEVFAPWGWVKEKVHYLPGEDDWNANFYGNLMSISLSEIDDELVNASMMNGTSVVYKDVGLSTSSSVQFDLNQILLGLFTNNAVNSTFGSTGSSGNGPPPVAITSTVGYNSAAPMTTLTTNNQFQIQAQRVVDMGDMEITYCGSENWHFSGNIIFEEGTYQRMDDQHTLMNFWNEILDWH